MDNSLGFGVLTPSDDKSSDSFLMMRRIAEDAPLDGFNVNGDKLLNKAKLFLVAQACNELNRIIKLTTLLDKVEEKFISAIDAKLEESPHNLALMTNTMETLSKSLAASHAMITQVLKDDKLSSIIINTTNIITPDGSSATIMDMNSRDTVRNMASSILAELSHIEDSEVTDVKVLNSEEIPNNESK